MLEKISSPQNPRIKHMVRLRDRTHRRRQGVFLVEGKREVERAIAVGWPIQTLFVCEEFIRDHAAMELLDRSADSGVEHVLVAADAFRKCSGRENPDGWMALAAQRELQLSDLRLSNNPLICISDGVEKPGNLGAIFRTANAAAADALILSGNGSDPYNPNCVRASQGSLFDLPFVHADSSAIRDFLARNQIQPWLMTPHSTALLWKCDLRGPTALLFGAEDTGLADEWMHCGLPTCKLPMSGLTDSLNVSVSVGIALFEARRQRCGSVI